MNKTLKKIIVAFTTAATVLSMSGVVLAIPVNVSAATVVDGDLIRNPNAEGMAKFDIYIVKVINSKNYKRLILSPHVFESYAHFDKNMNGSPWDDVMDVNQATMDMYTVSELVRADGDEKVYKLVATEGSDTGTKEWLNMTAAEFEAAGYDWDEIYTINSTDRDAYNAGTDITEGGEEEPVVSEGTLTVSLAADTPAAGIAVQNAARVPFTKVNLTASGGDVIVDSIIVERTGTVAQDAGITSIDVINADNNMPINVTSKTLNSLHKATFTDNITILKGTTKSLMIAANMPASLDNYSGETPSLALSDVVLKGDATLNASFPIIGNPMTLNSTVTIGTATVQRGAYTNATSSAIQVGKVDYTFFSFQVQAGSAEKVEFSQIKIYQEGSASLGTDLTNIELLQDGVKIADANVIDSKYATFNFTPITLNKGQIGQFQVRSDVSDGSARTVILGIYKTTDLLVKGNTYGYNITPTYSSTGASSASPVLRDNEFTISNGTLQVTRSNTVGATNVAVSNDQFLGAYEFVCKGEPINISAITLTITSSTNSAGTGALLNLELVDPNGTVVAGPTDPASTDGVTVSWTDTFTVPTGTSIYKVRGDLQTSASWASDDTLYVSITPSGMTATGEVTGNTIAPTPSSALSGNTQTVKAAALTVTRNTMPASKYVIVNQKDLVLSSWNFDASNSGEDIRITSLLWAGHGQSASNTDSLTTFIDVNKNGLWDSGTDTVLSPTSDAISTVGSSTVAFEEPIIITKGTSVDIALKGDKDSTNSNDTENWGLCDTALSVIAYGVNSGNSVVESLTADDGPTLTSIAKGNLTIETKSNPASAIVLAGSTGNVFSNVQFAAKYEAIDIDELTVWVADGSYSFNAGSGEYRDVTKVSLYDGTTKLGEASIPSTGYYTFNFSKGDIRVETGALNAKVITIKADMSTIDADADNAPGTNSADLKIGFYGADSIKSTGAESNNEITGTSYEIYRDSTSSVMVLRSSKPTVTLPTTANSLGASTALSNGDIPVYAFKITADASGGNVLFYRSTFVVATSGSGMTVTNMRLEDQNGNTLVTAADPTPFNIDGNSEYYWTPAAETGFNNPDFTVYSGADTQEAIEIAAGQSRTFKLYAHIEGASTGETFSTFLVGDTASTSSEVNTSNTAEVGPADAEKNCSQGWVVPAGDFASKISNFIWSDNYKQYTISGQTNNATTGGQWYNGHLVPGLGNRVSTTPYVISN
ncbi:hypothetical protein ACFLZ0_01175 [Patescibacteria group bacterium]